MLSERNSTNSLKMVSIFTVAAVLLLVLLVVLYLSVRQDSLDKTQPYSVSLQLKSNNDIKVFADYDYGYGFNAGHRQVFDLTNNKQQTVAFTISAWKDLLSLRLSSAENVDIQSVEIAKNNNKYQALETTGVISAGSDLVFSDINQKLLEAK